MLKGLFGRPRFKAEAAAAYEAVISQSRREGFYRDLGVPDSLDGRFDMIVLHVFLVLHRLKGQGEPAQIFSRALTESLFADMDASLRELGVGDLAVPRRIKDMLGGFFGRVQAYENGVKDTTGDRALCVALDNNLYGTVPSDPAALAAMAGYIRREAAALAAVPVEDILAGRVAFGPPPVPEPPAR